jgi:hypothetical protein
MHNLHKNTHLLFRDRWQPLWSATIDDLAIGGWTRAGDDLQSEAKIFMEDSPSAKIRFLEVACTLQLQKEQQ